MSTFTEIKNAYKECRENERLKIVKYLNNHGFEASSKGGNGLKKYKSGGSLKRPFDLTNWKYIHTMKNGRRFLISLQAFDKDPNTKNHHVLMDRIGVYAYENCCAEDAFELMIATDIELPMTDESLEELLNILDRFV